MVRIAAIPLAWKARKPLTGFRGFESHTIRMNLLPFKVAYEYVKGREDYDPYYEGDMFQQATNDYHFFADPSWFMRTVRFGTLFIIVPAIGLFLLGEEKN